MGWKMLPNNPNCSFKNVLFLICKWQWFLLSDTPCTPAQHQFWAVCPEQPVFLWPLEKGWSLFTGKMNPCAFDTCIFSSFWGWIIGNTSLHFCHCPSGSVRCGYFSFKTWRYESGSAKSMYTELVSRGSMCASYDLSGEDSDFSYHIHRHVHTHWGGLMWPAGRLDSDRHK